MKTSAEITVVVPVYNRADIVGRTLDSIAAQSLRPLELIVVDNASTDNSREAVTEWARRNEGEGLTVRILHESRRGPGAARARGLQETKTPLVYFFDSDDILQPGVLQAFTETFRNIGGVDIVCGTLIRENPDGSRRVTSPPGRELLLNHFHHATLCTLAYAARTDFLRRVGGWNPELRIWEDWELGIRILLADARVERIPMTIARILTTHDSVTGDLYSHRAEYYEPVLQRVEQIIRDSDHPDRKLLLRLSAGRRMMLAAHFAREGRRDLSSPLRKRVLRATRRDLWLNLLLRGAYHYRRLGLRGADRLTTLLLGRSY